MFTNAQKKNSFNNKAFAGFLSKQYKKKKKILCRIGFGTDELIGLKKHEHPGHISWASKILGVSDGMGFNRLTKKLEYL